MSRSGDFCGNKQTDKTDCLTACACARGKDDMRMHAYGPYLGEICRKIDSTSGVYVSCTPCTIYCAKLSKEMISLEKDSTGS
jgi:hypothetical protein